MKTQVSYHELLGKIATVVFRETNKEFAWEYYEKTIHIDQQ